MDSFQELTSETEKNSLNEFLTIKKNQQKQLEIFDNYWYTSRIIQSINYFVIKKRIFVDNLSNIRVILLTFPIKKSRFVDNIEIWINDDLSINEIDTITNRLLKLSQSLLDINHIVFYRTLPTCLADNLKRFSIDHQMKVVFQVKVNNYFFNFNKETIQQYSVPGFELKRIPTKNVEQVAKNWKYGVEQDIDWMRNSIENQSSLGIWDTSTNEMIGQFIYMLTGTHGSLTINDKYRGLGLAKMLTIGLLKLINEINMEMLIEIEDDNIASKCLFEKLRFDKATESIYLVLDKINNTLIPGKDF